MQGEQHFIEMRDGIELHLNVSEKGHQKWLIATHGIGEHFGRQGFLLDQLSASYNIIRYDLRGHGLSTGDPAYIDDFQDFILDLDEVIGFAKKRYRVEDYSLFGHSMGALITSSYLQNKARKSFYPTKVFLSAPPVELPGLLGNIVAHTSSRLIGLLTMSPLSLRLSGLVNVSDLSHSKVIGEQYLEDQRNHLGLHSKLLFEMIKCSKETFSKPINPHCPCFVIAGSEDNIVSCEAIKKYFEEVETSFTVKIVEGGYHELHHEIEKLRNPYFEFLKTSLA